MRVIRKLPAAAIGIALAASGTAAGGALAAYTAEPAERDSRTAPAAAPQQIVPVVQPAAPLGRVVPPDILAVGARSLSAGQLRKIRKLKKVRDVIVVDGGAVQVQGRQINTFGVDPERFRAWTPPGTAAKAELWTALSRDEFVVSGTTSGQLGLTPGASYTLVGKTAPQVRLGGSGSLGLPGVDLLVSQTTAEQVGLIRDLGIMVNAPGADVAKLGKGMGKILGAGSQIMNLHAKKNQPPADSGAPSGRPASYMDLYRQAATTCPGLSWTVLAAIGQVESGHGRNMGPSSAGALGPMQFMPATWRAYGVDGDGDRRADIMNPYDAVPAAAKYLCASGGGKGGQSLYKAVFAYNHSNSYVNKVLSLAGAYGRAYS